MKCELGQEVGYSIRFEDASSKSTRVKFLTDGLLLKEAMVDPLLSRYSVIMVDEAHERSLSSDILLGLLKKILKRRPDLRLIVSSATMQAEEILRFFVGNDEGQAGAVDIDSIDSDPQAAIGSKIGRIISLQGRAYPVDVEYLSTPSEDYIQTAVDTVLSIHTNEAKDGDILIFLSGREEIETCIQKISEAADKLPADNRALQALPLFAGLTTEQQEYVFEPAVANTRKVVCSTNIAETSVTIDGIVHVVDCGFVKLRAYNATSGIESLTAVSISKASAVQRCGRAGRTRPGKCYRLYTKEAFEAMEELTVPEIQRSNLAPVILQLKALGIERINSFSYLSPPPAQLVSRGLELLYSLGALDDHTHLTKPLGLRMAELGGVEPMMAKVLLSASEFGCLDEMLNIAAMTSIQGSVWFDDGSSRKARESARHKFAAEEGDHITLLNVYKAFTTSGKKESKWCHTNFLNYKSMTRAVSIRNQLKRYLEKFGIKVDEPLAISKPAKAPMADVGKSEAIRRCLTTGYFSYAARMRPDGSFQTVNGTILWAHPSSLMFNRKADWVIFHEIMDTGRKTYIREVSKIDKDWLVQYAPDFYRIR